MRLRPAAPADAPAVAGVHVRSWQAAYRGLLPQDYLDALRPEDRAARYTFGAAGDDRPRTTVALADGVVGGGDGAVAGAILGFATTAPAADDDLPGAGELCALYVDPEHWGGGVGRALMAHARAELAGRGFDRAVLWVLVGNDRAGRFYVAGGWRPDGTRRSVEIWGVTVDETRFRRALP